MKPIMRNRYLVALESAMAASKDGRKPHGFLQTVAKHIAEKGGMFKRVLFEGELVYLPVNRIALEEFVLMSTEERVQVMFSQPPPTAKAPMPCESKRIVQGSRFKGTPVRMRESDLFDADGNPRYTPQQMREGEGPGHSNQKQRKIYLSRVSGPTNISRARRKKATAPDVIAMAMKNYHLSYEDAADLIAELKKRNTPDE